MCVMRNCVVLVIVGGYSCVRAPGSSLPVESVHTGSDCVLECSDQSSGNTVHRKLLTTTSGP